MSDAPTTLATLTLDAPARASTRATSAPRADARRPAPPRAYSPRSARALTDRHFPTTRYERLEWPARETPTGRPGLPTDKRGNTRLEVPELRAREARGIREDLAEYDEMTRSDGTAGGTLGMLSRTISGARHDVALHRRHFAPDRDPQLAAAERFAARFAARFCGLDGTDAWLVGGLPSLVRSLALAFEYGHAAHEIVWQTVTYFALEGGGFAQYLVPSRVELRHPLTCVGWTYSDTNTLTGVLQKLPKQDTSWGFGRWSPYDPPRRPDSLDVLHAWGHDVVEIAAENLLLYAHQYEDQGPSGRSILRPGWIFWRAKKDTILRDEMAQERSWRGMPYVEELLDAEGLPFPTISKPDFAAFEDAFEAYLNELANYVEVPAGLRFDAKYPAAQIPDPTARLEYYDHQIRLALAATILGLGARVGQELSGTHGQLFYNGVKALSDQVLEVINGQPGRPWTGLIKRLIDANVAMAAHPDFIYPKIVARGIQFQDPKARIAAIREASQFQIIRYSVATEEMVREELELPPLDDPEREGRYDMGLRIVETTAASNATSPTESQEPQARDSEEGTQGPVEPPDQLPVADTEDA